MGVVAASTPGGVPAAVMAVLRGQPDRARAAVSAILADPRPAPAHDPWLSLGPGAQYQRVRLRADGALTAWVYRQWTLEHLLAALPLSDGTLSSGLLAEARAAPDPSFAGAVAHALLRATPPPPVVLDTLAGELDPGLVWSPFAAEARVVRDGVAAMGPLAAYFSACPPQTSAQAALRLVLRPDLVDFDQVPAWVDLLVPASPTSLELLGRLLVATTSEPLLRALAVSRSNEWWADCLNRLRSLDDPAAAPRLRAFVGSVPPGASADEKRLLRVVKHLERKRTNKAATFDLRDAVGTDGGPVLLGSPLALAEWRGADREAPLETGDYARAIACGTEPGWIEVAGSRVLVLPEPQVAVGCRGAGWWFVSRGAAVDVEVAAAGRRSRKQRETFEVAAGGLLLLDAAHPVDSAPPGATDPVSMPAGTYSVWFVQSGTLSAVRLEPKVPRTG